MLAIAWQKAFWGRFHQQFLSTFVKENYSFSSPCFCVPTDRARAFFEALHLANGAKIRQTANILCQKAQNFVPRYCAQRVK